MSIRKQYDSDLEALKAVSYTHLDVYKRQFLNRLLIPTGLHHALNNVFWFDTIGLGDLSHFWAGETSADAVSYTHL